MLRALAGRLAFALAIVLFAFASAYLLTDLAPGDPLDEGVLVPIEDLEARRARLGLDRPAWVRLGERLSRLAVLDFGTSLRYDRPVRALLAERTLGTLQAGGAALLLAVLLGIPAGVVAATSRYAPVRQAIAALSLAAMSVPALVFALLLAVSATTAGLPSLVVMTLALGLPAAALLERVQARALSVALAETCLDAARARGVPRRVVTWRHAWPLSLPSVLGVAGLVGGHLLSGALAIELITARSGLGLLTFEALTARDMDLAAGCAATAALLVGAMTFTADALQLWLDPRTQTGQVTSLSVFETPR